MKSYNDYLLVKQAASLFTPHQRMGLQIGRMFERTKGKSQASTAILNSQNSRGPMSMNDIALRDQQREFDKQQKDFSKQQKDFEKQKEDLQGQVGDLESRQRELQNMREELEHKETLMRREKELRKLEERGTSNPRDEKPDRYAESLNNHARDTAKRVRSTIQRLLRR